jgi:hypothetical protein
MNGIEHVYNLFSKREKSPEDFSEYVPYMINRWVSFVNPSLALLINNSFNKGDYHFLKKEHYCGVSSCIPQIKKMGRISYVKKIKQEPDIDLKTLARNLEMSQRELKTLISLDQTLNKIHES